MHLGLLGGAGRHQYARNMGDTGCSAACVSPFMHRDSLKLKAGTRGGNGASRQLTAQLLAGHAEKRYHILMFSAWEMGTKGVTGDWLMLVGNKGIDLL